MIYKGEVAKKALVLVLIACILAGCGAANKLIDELKDFHGFASEEEIWPAKTFESVFALLPDAAKIKSLHEDPYLDEQTETAYVLDAVIKAFATMAPEKAAEAATTLLDSAVLDFGQKQIAAYYYYKLHLTHDAKIKDPAAVQKNFPDLNVMLTESWENHFAQTGISDVQEQNIFYDNYAQKLLENYDIMFESGDIEISDKDATPLAWYAALKTDPDDKFYEIIQRLYLYQSFPQYWELYDTAEYDYKSDALAKAFEPYFARIKNKAYVSCHDNNKEWSLAEIEQMLAEAPGFAGAFAQPGAVIYCTEYFETEYNSGKLKGQLSNYALLDGLLPPGASRSKDIIQAAYYLNIGTNHTFHSTYTGGIKGYATTYNLTLIDLQTGQTAASKTLRVQPGSTAYVYEGTEEFTASLETDDTAKAEVKAWLEANIK
ncbi:MAG: hypothetical protein FWD16_02410 [Clostridia bacterium]|nr:hypothetical protein [Clostridia bacterium]